LEQFQRSSLIIGDEAIKMFREKKILIVGLGGVGGYAVEGLARAGFLNFTLVDFDTVSESNINRQIIALHSTIGKSKCQLFKERILDINPDCNVVAISEFLDQDLRGKLIDEADFIVDAIDSLGPKVGLLEDCYLKGKDMVSSMGAGNKLDPERIKIVDISKSQNCSLAKRVRKYLRKRGIYKGIPVVFSDELPITDYLKDGRGQSAEESTRGRNRTLVGSISYYPAIMGMMLASYVIRFYLNGKDS